ncbi:MAG: HAD family hydrolase [Coriobacteriia bacterium]|nr:HAD family hydrolase [Coriobacteriia bacterium]
MRGILFDLDGTLLDIDLDAFLARYFAALETAMEPLLAPTGLSGPEALGALSAATRSMAEPHPGRTNRDVFHEDFLRRTGIDLDETWDLFENFYAEEYPALGDGCGPKSGARDAVLAALELGLKVAVATNPIFPVTAINHRLAWAGLSDLPIHAVTAYETMHACKPLPEYFRQTAGLLGVEPGQCMMVGDDRFLDMAAGDVGMLTYYVGDHPEAATDFRGDLVALAALLPRLVG